MQLNQDVQFGNSSRGGALYDDNGHRYIWLGMEEEDDGKAVQINQYVVQHGKRTIMLDPGGVHTYATVVSNLSRFVDLDAIDTLFFSHQDPDVSSGVGLWLNTTRAKVMISRLWKGFLPHFGSVDSDRLEPIADEGMRMDLGGGGYLHILPAHFLHSVGNFSVYDPQAKILFSGDIGSSVFPKSQERYPFVEDFDAHIRYMEGFHKRYMSCNAACKEWVKRVSRLEIDAITPQHGALITGGNVKRFFDWFAELECGIDNLNRIYGQG